MTNPIVAFAASILLAPAFGGAIRAGANGADCMVASRYRPGLPEELLSGAELNTLSSACIAERMRTQLVEPSLCEPPAEAKPACSFAMQAARLIRAPMTQLLYAVFHLPHAADRGQLSQKEISRRPMMLLSASDGTTHAASAACHKQHWPSRITALNKLNKLNKFSLAGLAQLVASHAVASHAVASHAVACLGLSLGVVMLVLARKEVMLKKAYTRMRIQRQQVSEAAAITGAITTQLASALRENSAIKAALQNTLKDRDALQTQVSRLTFERDNFKESLQQTMKPSRDGARTQSRFHEDSDILGHYADREWKSRQRLTEAESRIAGLAEEAARTQQQLARLAEDLENARYGLAVEKQKATSLRAERDLYASFARLSAAHKRHLAQVLADLHERRYNEERLLNRRVLRLMDWVVTTGGDVEELLSGQRGLVSALNDCMGALRARLSEPYGMAVETRACLSAYVNECTSLSQDLAAGLETQGAGLERYLSRVQSLSERIAAFVLSMAHTPRDGANVA